ncbi:hypothetical protein MRY87_02040 [bacterium]|nr:hypothetical protein [bacterium]
MVHGGAPFRGRGRGESAHAVALAVLLSGCSTTEGGTPRSLSLSEEPFTVALEERDPLRIRAELRSGLRLMALEPSVARSDLGQELRERFQGDPALLYQLLLEGDEDIRRAALLLLLEPSFPVLPEVLVELAGDVEFRPFYFELLQGYAAQAPKEFPSVLLDTLPPDLRYIPPTMTEQFAAHANQEDQERVFAFIERQESRAVALTLLRSGLGGVGLSCLEHGDEEVVCAGIHSLLNGSDPELQEVAESHVSTFLPKSRRCRIQLAKTLLQYDGERFGSRVVEILEEEPVDGAPNCLPFGLLALKSRATETFLERAVFDENPSLTFPYPLDFALSALHQAHNPRAERYYEGQLAEASKSSEAMTLIFSGLIYGYDSAKEMAISVIGNGNGGALSFSLKDRFRLLEQCMQWSAESSAHRAVIDEVESDDPDIALLLSALRGDEGLEESLREFILRHLEFLECAPSLTGLYLPYARPEGVAEILERVLKDPYLRCFPPFLTVFLEERQEAEGADWGEQVVQQLSEAILEQGSYSAWMAFVTCPDQRVSPTAASILPRIRYSPRWSLSLLLEREDLFASLCTAALEDDKHFGVLIDTLMETEPGRCSERRRAILRELMPLAPDKGLSDRLRFFLAREGDEDALEYCRSVIDEGDHRRALLIKVLAPSREPSVQQEICALLEKGEGLDVALRALNNEPFLFRQSKKYEAYVQPSVRSLQRLREAGNSSQKSSLKESVLSRKLLVFLSSLNLDIARTAFFEESFRSSDAPVDEVPLFRRGCSTVAGREAAVAAAERTVAGSESKREKYVAEQFLLLMKKFETVGILHPYRFPKDLREELYQNLKNPERDDRPKAVFVLPRDDWNGAWADPEFLTVLHAAHETGFRMEVYEAKNGVGYLEQIIAAARLGSEQEQPAQLVYIAGHGGKNSIVATQSGDDQTLTAEDFNQVPLEQLQRAIAIGAQGIVHSCAAGAGGAAEFDSIPNTLRRFIPHFAEDGIFSCREITTPVKEITFRDFRIEHLQFGSNAPEAHYQARVLPKQKAREHSTEVS